MAKKKCIGYKCTILKVVIANRQRYCRFFFLSLLISRVAKVKYRNDSIWRPGAYLLLVPQGWPLIRKRAHIYFLRKCR